MKIIWSTESWDDFEWWLDNDKKLVKRIRKLLHDVMRNPFDGIGKPEPLKGDYSGLWSRRISEEHRLIYYVEKGDLYIVSVRYHYHR
ncbi:MULTISPECIES: Txe/YoeB family addiction module toxin [Fructobacillus]|uniref:Endoribonuclease YoeB n=1 Tax=Fructobacillus papyrifericola TaxID=2713172 RepID=A0ABS5QS31_9LACO|nr:MULTISPECIES: Txe/YoeB family addiction module toxin [Fructobacillus]MBS9336008.1 Txe/YoeB family addiction module toxin [Fructobacillus papyrifericola]MCK8637995.1 Txe/YoeB family addiction module toxin [Fructobacillus fructosus]